MNEPWPAAMPFKTAAKYLGYDSTTPIEQLLRDEEIRAIQVVRGGDRRIPKDELDKLIGRRLTERVEPRR